MKNGIRGRREFSKPLVDRVFEIKEKHGFKSVDALVNAAIENLEEDEQVIDALKKASLNIRLSSDNLAKLERLAESSKTQVGKRVLGGNDTAVITFAVETFINKRLEEGEM